MKIAAFCNELFIGGHVKTMLPYFQETEGILAVFCINFKRFVLFKSLHNNERKEKDVHNLPGF